MGKTVAKIIAYVILALVLVAAVGLIYKFTNGFNEDFKTFYVEYGGKQILTADSKQEFKQGAEHRFTVHYTFDNEKSEPKDYSVKIVPHAERDFDYTVDGEKYLYSKTGELTSAFGLKKEQTEFSIVIPSEYSLQKVLEATNSGKRVVVPEDAETNNPYPYRLVVSSYNGKVTYNIDFKLIPTVTDITLNPDEIIFGGKETPDTPVTPAEKKYDIDIDSLGWAGMDVINLTCPDKAAAGETVTFTATVKPEYANEFKISGINVNYGSGDEYLQDIRNENGTYTFKMPDASTLEADGYITLMFYIIPVDM